DFGLRKTKRRPRGRRFVCKRSGLLDQELVHVAAFAGIGRQPARLLAPTGPGLLRIGRVAVLRRYLAERLARLLGRAAGGAGGAGSAGARAEQFLKGVTLVLGLLGELLADLADRLALAQRGLALLGLADQ